MFLSGGFWTQILAILCVLERGFLDTNTGHSLCSWAGFFWHKFWPFFVFLSGGFWTRMLPILCVLERGFLDTNVGHSLCPKKCFEQVVQNPHRLIGKLWLRAFLWGGDRLTGSGPEPPLFILLEELEFYWNSFTKEGLMPAFDKVKAVKDYRCPEKKEKKFVPRYTSITAPLRKISRRRRSDSNWK